ncbi:MAG: SusC/RagA family TonB-linked outer membrane protein [Bacteroidota bacterium]
MHRINHSITSGPLLLLMAMISLFTIGNSHAQESLVKGSITDHLSGAPLQQVLVTLSGASGESRSSSTLTDESGNFEVGPVGEQALLTVQLPGYHTRQIHTYGRKELRITMVNTKFHSMDEAISTPFGMQLGIDRVSSLEHISLKDFDKSTVTSIDQELYARIPGINVIAHSGMPGDRNFNSIRGLSSLLGRNEPLVVIDGMIHETNYGNYSAIDGFNLNPMDVLDIDDVASMTVLKNARSGFGGKASNGVIYVNTEQKSETSTSIRFHFQGGVTSMPTMLESMDAGQFRSYMNEQLLLQELDQAEIDTRYPWLNGSSDAEDSARYNNDTRWQEELFRMGRLQKYHFFLKGGDDIATYNISTGYINHQGIVNNSNYSRYNLNLNGSINLSRKFSITPHAKLGLATSQLQEQGHNQVTNPILTAQLKPAIMAPYTETQSETGESFLDDVGVFNLSNPTAIVSTLLAENINFHFLTSADLRYKFTEAISLTSTFGIDYNNSRDNIFIPDHGLASIDSARNTTRSMITFFQSIQNHSHLDYHNLDREVHDLRAAIGVWTMSNKYEYDLGTDLNSPTDDFTSLGQGAEDQFLRTSLGTRRTLNWVSLYSRLDYSYLGKYFVRAGLSKDGSSALNELNRYNIYPSFGGAWKISSEDLLNRVSWIDLLRIRATYGITGNTYNTAYDDSRLYYRGRRLNEIGVLTRESIPNEQMALEKRSMSEAGLDLVVLNQKLALQVDYYLNVTGNMIVPQTLPPAYGYTRYYDNAGAYRSSGVEASLDFNASAGNLIWTSGISITTQSNAITSLSLGDAAEHPFLITTIEGAELVTMEGHPIYSFYGYKTNGTYTEAEAGTVIGPNGDLNRAGDIRYAGDEDGIIDENDKVIIGNPNPKMYGGFFNSFRYKSLSVDVNFSYYYGNDLYNYVSMKSHAVERLSGLNDGAEINIGDSYGNSVFSDQWIEEGSYLKLSNLTIAYSFPKATRAYKSLMIYAKGSNLFTITPYSGYCPEFMFATHPATMGVDYGKMPITKSFVIGIKVGL